MRAKIAGDRVALPIGWKLRAADNFQPAELRIIPGADTLQFTTHVGVSEVSRARYSETNSLKSCAISDERLPKFIKVVAPRIAKAAQQNAQLHCGGAQMPDAAAVQVHQAVRR